MTLTEKMIAEERKNEIYLVYTYTKELENLIGVTAARKKIYEISKLSDEERGMELKRLIDLYNKTYHYPYYNKH